jgi:ABC-type sugar transport system permease subunit
MSQIKNGHTKMKPRWYFILGSLTALSGFIGLTIVLIFLVSLTTFSLRTHGPMGAVRYEQLLSSFPWWAPLVAIIGLGFGIWLLKKYDFSYRKDFFLIILGVVATILITGWLMDYLGLDNIWIKKGPMRGLYHQYNGSSMKKIPFRG